MARLRGKLTLTELSTATLKTVRHQKEKPQGDSVDVAWRAVTRAFHGRLIVRLTQSARARVRS